MAHIKTEAAKISNAIATTIDHNSTNTPEGIPINPPSNGMLFQPIEPHHFLNRIDAIGNPLITRLDNIVKKGSDLWDSLTTPEGIRFRIRNIAEWVIGQQDASENLRKTAESVLENVDQGVYDQGLKNAADDLMKGWVLPNAGVIAGFTIAPLLSSLFPDSEIALSAGTPALNYFDPITPLSLVGPIRTFLLTFNNVIRDARIARETGETFDFRRSLIKTGISFGLMVDFLGFLSFTPSLAADHPELNQIVSYRLQEGIKSIPEGLVQPLRSTQRLACTLREEAGRILSDAGERARNLGENIIIDALDGNIPWVSPTLDLLNGRIKYTLRTYNGVELTKPIIEEYKDAGITDLGTIAYLRHKDLNPSGKSPQELQNKAIAMLMQNIKSDEELFGNLATMVEYHPDVFGGLDLPLPNQDTVNIIEMTSDKLLLHEPEEEGQMAFGILSPKDPKFKKRYAQRMAVLTKRYLVEKYVDEREIRDGHLTVRWVDSPDGEEKVPLPIFFNPEKVKSMVPFLAIQRQEGKIKPIGSFGVIINSFDDLPIAKVLRSQNQKPQIQLDSTHPDNDTLDRDLSEALASEFASEFAELAFIQQDSKSLMLLREVFRKFALFERGRGSECCFGTWDEEAHSKICNILGIEPFPELSSGPIHYMGSDCIPAITSWEWVEQQLVSKYETDNRKSRTGFMLFMLTSPDLYINPRRFLMNEYGIDVPEKINSQIISQVETQVRTVI